MKFEYPAIRIRQTELDKWTVFFGAPAYQINSWSGIPQKQEIEGTETTGFQRDVNTKRINNISKFFLNQNNIVQNPLLCASRTTTQGGIQFTAAEDCPQNGYAEVGTITINLPEYSDMNILDLLQEIKVQMLARHPDLENQEMNLTLLNRLKAEFTPGENEEDDEAYDNDDNGNTYCETDESVFVEESYLTEFWDGIIARIAILKEIDKDELEELESALGYSKEAILAYIKPVVIVDGQHRLVGALNSAVLLAETEHKDQIQDAVIEGRDPVEAQKEIEEKVSRNLPISLLMDDDPAEHVFQFVVVNQKATPISKPLLGTIVSTSLTESELERVGKRLSDAEIPLEQSKAISLVTRDPASPFYGLVDKGYKTQGGSNLLKWNVLGSLVSIFRNLKGGSLFHERTDYADLWRKRLLDQSEIVADFDGHEFESKEDYWGAIDGPWKEVFIKFYSEIRDTLGNQDTPEIQNYWGNPRISNIFNKVTLTYLAADFFQYLSDTKKPINSAEDIPEYVEEWLEGVKPEYFARDWRLTGVKKDSTGIRKRWSSLWVEYRKDPSTLKRVTEFRKPLESKL